MIYAELQQDTLAWQRALKFAGMYRGKLDGLTGPLTREAAAQWRESHKQLQTRYGRLDKRTEDNARGGQSMHNFGVAADVCLFRDGVDIWAPSEGPNSIYKPVAVLARQLGLVWGGAWRTPYDPGHVQLGELSTATLHHAYTTGSATLAQLL